MTGNRLIARESRDSGDSSARSAGVAYQLPPDLLLQSCRRVGLAATVFAILWLVGLTVNTVGNRVFPEAIPDYLGRFWPVPGLYFTLFGIGLSVAMVVIAGRLHHRPVLLLDIGLVYLVLSSALVGLWNQWEPLAHRTGPTVSWICILVLVYPTIAPNTPRKILLAGLVAASMDPLALAFTSVFRKLPVSATGYELFWAFFPNYLCAVLATLPARIIGRLGRQVRKAREMGSYQLVSQIGKGGMGEVYRAEHHMLARPAAIKVIRPDLLGSSKEAQITLSRFRREAEAVAMLRSPHTIDLYDFGVTDEGAFYFVMELLEGLDLEKLIDRFGSLPAGRAVYLAIQASDSLAEAHQRGMVHRDIKPSNILACRMGLEVDFVKVLDFGLVKADRLPNRDLTKLTSPELTTGTPAFMAPEMVEEGKPVDARVDIYAMGCCIYWMLTGQLVFDAANPVAMMMKHVNDKPAPPSMRSEEPIPPALDALVMECLAKHPDDRPADAVALARRLSDIVVPQRWDQKHALEWWGMHLPDLPPEVESPDRAVVAGSTA